MGTKKSRTAKFVSDIILGRNMSDSRLFGIAEEVNREWRKVRYNLLRNGYVESSHTTFLIAKQVMKTSLADALSNVGCEWQDVDKYHLSKLIEGSRNDVITYCMFQFPSLGGFTAFYYKEKNKRMNDVMQSSGYDIGVEYGTDNVENLTMVKEHMEMVKLMSAEDDIVEQLECEIEALTSVIRFVGICEELTDVVDGIFDEYIYDTKHKLDKIVDDVEQTEYNAIRDVEGKKIQAVANRFADGLLHLMSVSEN